MRPPIPAWVVDSAQWNGPRLPYRERHQQWEAARIEWLDSYGYDVFDLNDAEVAHRHGLATTTPH